MIRVWIRCFVLPSALLREENQYRIRTYDGSILEGVAARTTIVPTFSATLTPANENEKPLLCVWGAVVAELLRETGDRMLVTLPDGQIAEIKSSRVMTRSDAVKA